ncbi:hypothetical protein EZ449_14000 [Pedobacter frigidisoli]|uniref:Uncharacterized protein n=1 Tax=Pedobacter frigidisoli TaxID=2530455 RepID=A0A4R0NZN3_9SPHI|nr:hypothetical protein [Pedobacter frigidisoli]TCD07645.1 hypothetical protein EZ449_14000 [Pedobacter frigidisoli]
MSKQVIFICLVLTGIAKLTHAQENLKIAWPGEYKWKIGSEQKSGNARMVELIPGNESINNWTIIGTMLSITGRTSGSVEKAMNTTYNQTLGNAPKARLKIIEKGIKSGSPWILFRVESPYFNNSKTPESQLYYIIQGNQALYSNFVAIKQPALGVLFVEKWSKVFKNSMIVGK